LCTATDSDGAVQSVTVDLSQIGGPNAQALIKGSDDQWSWSGPVTPRASGLKTVTFTAVDDKGASVTAECAVTASPPSNAPPTINNPSVSGALTEGELSAVTALCTATDSDGAVQSVTADLSQMGGPNAQALTKGSDDQWSWSGPVTPPSSGLKTVTFTAIDDGGAIGTGEGSIAVGVAPPTFDPNGGSFVNSVDVAIECQTAGATIYYTTDGNEPTCSNGTLYTGLIRLTEPVTLKAIACKEGSPPSTVAQARFTDLVEEIRASPEFQTALSSLTGKIQSRTWISYSPRNYDPNINAPPAGQIRQDLELLRREGFDGIIYYTSKPPFCDIPTIAKDANVGFDGVIAGIWNIDDADEIQKAARNANLIDGVIVGNERLSHGVSLESLRRAMNNALVAIRKPVSTSEERENYFIHPELIGFSDWLAPNIHPYWDGVPTPVDGVQAVVGYYQGLQRLTTQAILIKETGWPTNGSDRASELAQWMFYERLKQQNVRFSYFEAFDQAWKREEPDAPPEEPYWGMHHPDGSRKLTRDPNRFADLTIGLLTAQNEFVSLSTGGALISKCSIGDAPSGRVWSPKRDRLALCRSDRTDLIDRSCNPIRSVNATLYPGNGADFSKDARYLFYSRYNDGIYRIDWDDGSVVRIVVSLNNTFDHDPKVSPDGSKLFYIHHEFGKQAYFRIWRFSDQSDELVYQTTTEHDAVLPVEWIDNDTLAFVNTRADASDAGLNLLTISSKERTAVAPHTWTIFRDPWNEKLYCYSSLSPEQAGEVHEIGKGGLTTVGTVLWNLPVKPYYQEPILSDVGKGAAIFYSSAPETASGIYLWRPGDSFPTHWATERELQTLIGWEADTWSVQDLHIMPP
jgi:exo-beta-1,3-glucanase (GH17 family)